MIDFVGTKDATSGRAIPEPWVVAPNADVLAIREGGTLRGSYLGTRHTEEGLTVHDLLLVDDHAEADNARIVVWGGSGLQILITECTKFEVVNLRYLGSYVNEFGITVYRWQLWRELAAVAP